MWWVRWRYRPVPQAVRRGTRFGQNFRGNSNPGNIVPPTRVIVSRKLPSGELIENRVDVKRAMHDPRERLLIAPGDVVSLEYTPEEIASNFAINLVTFNFMVIVNRK